MMILGLTGPTGAGKSEAARAFAAKGFAVVDADRVAHQMMSTRSICTTRIAKEFGKNVLNSDGSLNRTALASIVFSDPQKLKTLNQITHPLIVTQMQKELNEAKAEGHVGAIVDAPMLFDSGADQLCGRVVAVLADERVRLPRIMTRDGLDRKRALQRMHAQPKESFYLSHADEILRNNGNTASLAWMSPT